MNRRSKIILYSLILLVSIYLKQCGDVGLFDLNARKDAGEFTSEANEELVDQKADEVIDVPLSNQIIDQKVEEIMNELEREAPDLTLPCGDFNSLDNGHSPYDSYFGSGVYHNWTQHSLTIKTSDENAVCLLKDVSSGKVIRNEFIRKNSFFELTGIPHGTYKLQYYTGFDWDNDYLVPNTSIKGGFKCDASFSESSNPSDWLRFEYSEQYSNRYTVTLYKVANGNMETKEINSYSFF